MIYFPQSDNQNPEHIVIYDTSSVHALFVWIDDNGLNPPGYCIRLVCVDLPTKRPTNFCNTAAVNSDHILLNVWASTPEEVFAIVNKMFPHLVDVGCPRDIDEDFIYDFWFAFVDAKGLSMIEREAEYSFKESEELNNLKAQIN